MFATDRRLAPSRSHRQSQSPSHEAASRPTRAWRATLRRYSFPTPIIPRPARVGGSWSAAATRSKASLGIRRERRRPATGTASWMPLRRVVPSRQCFQPCDRPERGAERSACAPDPEYGTLEPVGFPVSGLQRGVQPGRDVPVVPVGDLCLHGARRSTCK